jgi:type I site-specific restriction endonuclease
MKAVHAIQRAIKDKKDCFLFEMATGTGKKGLHPIAVR